MADLIVFWIFAPLAAGAGIAMLLVKNAVHSALLLIVTQLCLAIFFLELGSPFLFVVQIIVYAGAIMVLFLFVIMYLNLQHDVEAGLQTAVRRGIGWLTGAALLLIGATLLRRGWSLGPANETQADAELGNVAAIGKQLYSKYLFPFEITSILLLVAMVGVIIIARGRAKTASEGA